MKSRLKIAERMAVGFGLMLGVMAVLAWVVARQTGKIDGARRQLIEQLAPVSDAAERLELRVLYVAIDVRAWLVNPTAEGLTKVQQQVAHARAALLALEPLPRPAGSAQTYEAAHRRLGVYLDEVQGLIDRAHANEPQPPRLEQTLAARREDALGALREFSKRQRLEMNEALVAISAASNEAERVTSVGVALALLLFVVLAVLTVRSVREPARQLVEVARQLEQGEWTPAIQLAARSGEREPRDELGLLRRAFGSAAVALERREQRLNKLVLEVSDKGRQIQEQNEELQVQNEELQVQGEEIRAQNEGLQSQSHEIKAQNEELARATARLRGQAEVLAEADERKTEFLGVLAHELRNPLAAISNSLFALTHADGNAGLRERAVQVIGRQSKLLARLIDDLLDVTRINRGKIRIDRERVDLSAVLQAAVEDCKAAAERAGAQVQLELPSQPAWVDGDPVRLQQVLGNLIDNAIKFGGNQRPISIALSVKDDRSTEVRVVDEGVGIDGAVLSRLFVPFSQADMSVQRHRSGLGLGLALVKALVELHGGTVSASSAGLGHGAQFCVRFPPSQAETT